VDREDIQPVVQILAEGAFTNGPDEVAVGAAITRTLTRIVLRAAMPLELAVLQNAEQLGLELGVSSATSSRKIVEPWAISNRPTCLERAPV
jgi:hypothetical protein